MLLNFELKHMDTIWLNRKVSLKRDTSGAESQNQTCT